MKEVVELPMLHPEKFVKLGIDPPKGVLCYGPHGTGKTLLARAVANRTNAFFIRVIGNELVQKYVGEGARMVHELFQVQYKREMGLCFGSRLTKVRVRSLKELWTLILDDGLASSFTSPVTDDIKDDHHLACNFLVFLG